MKQMITRLDDDLHARLKAKAKAEGRSVNDLVAELIASAVAEPEDQARWHLRMVADGRLIGFEPDGPVPGRDEVERMSRGWGAAVSDALDWTRGDW